MRGIRSLLASLVGLLGHRYLLFPGALGAWWLYATEYSWQPGQQHMMYVLIGGWAFFNLVSARQLARMIRPKLQMDAIELPKPPPHMAPPASPAPVAAQRQPPVAPFVPGGPQPPRPTRVMLLVEPPSSAASPDEASIMARLNPSLRELMQRPADTSR